MLIGTLLQTFYESVYWILLIDWYLIFLYSSKYKIDQTVYYRFHFFITVFNEMPSKNVSNNLASNLVYVKNYLCK